MTAITSARLPRSSSSWSASRFSSEVRQRRESTHAAEGKVRGSRLYHCPSAASTHWGAASSM
jgi:hypothetical protein